MKDRQSMNRLKNGKAKERYAVYVRSGEDGSGQINTASHGAKGRHRPGAPENTTIIELARLGLGSPKEQK